MFPGSFSGKISQPLAESQWVMLAVVIKVTSYSPIPALLIRAEAEKPAVAFQSAAVVRVPPKRIPNRDRVRVRSPLQPNTTTHREDARL
jgi:hypothetical protein